MLLPFLLIVFPKVASECLLAPGAINRVRNRRKCADGFVFAGVTEELPPSFPLAPFHQIHALRS